MLSGPQTGVLLAPRSAEMVTASAYIDLLTGRLATAAAMARQALEYQPESPFAHYLLGQVALRGRAPREAIAAFDRARVSSGGAPKYVAALGRAYLAAGRTREARRMLDELRRQARIRYVAPRMMTGLAEGIKRHETRTSARVGVPPHVKPNQRPAAFSIDQAPGVRYITKNRKRLSEVVPMREEMRVVHTKCAAVARLGISNG